MNQRAYPEIGWRITISQGSGADESRGGQLCTVDACQPPRAKPGPKAEASVLRRRMDDELVVGPLRRGESVLSEAQ